MDHPAETKTVSQRKDPRTTVIELLRSRNKQARFMTELQASLARYGIGTEEADRALAELESERVVMIRDNFCADPHLTGVPARRRAGGERRWRRSADERNSPDRRSLEQVAE
jgi:hypothetical protein